MTPKVLVSVLLWNGRDRAVRTVRDLLAQRYSDMDVTLVVVDNGADRETVERIAALDQSVRIRATPRNLGFSGGNNVALDLAAEMRADIVFLLNDDLQLPHDYLARVVGAAFANADIGVIGTRIDLPDGSIQAIGGTLLPLRAGIRWIRNPIAAPGERTVDVIQGAAFALAGPVLAGGFRLDERLFFGGEEFDLALWAMDRGIRSIVLGDVRIVHDTEQADVLRSRWHVAPRHYYFATRSDVFLKRKHLGLTPSFVLSVSYTIIRNVLKGVIYAVRGNPAMLRAILLGICHGAIGRMGPPPF